MCILWMDMVKRMGKYFSHFICGFSNFWSLFCGFSDFRILKISEFLKPVLLFFQIFEFLNFLKIFKNLEPVLWWDISFYFKKNIFSRNTSPIYFYGIPCSWAREKTPGWLNYPQQNNKQEINT